MSELIRPPFTGEHACVPKMWNLIRQKVVQPVSLDGRSYWFISLPEVDEAPAGDAWGALIYEDGDEVVIEWFETEKDFNLSRAWAQAHGRRP
jgi:hypothetical protein